MILPCDTCKYKIEERQGHHVFVGCSDKEKRKGFRYDDFLYHHRCDSYESSEVANGTNT